MTPEKTDITTIDNSPLTSRHWYIVGVASMEQLIGAALSTIVGIIIPLLNLFLHPQLSSAVQGIMGASGLVGIAVGSAIIGPISDKIGYATWFKLCPALVLAGSILASWVPSPLLISLGLFVAGIGLGGGYTLDSSYISELMPDRWRAFMVGVSKATSAIGFIIPAVVALIILHIDPTPNAWRSIVWITSVLAIITILLRLKWPGSPRKLIELGHKAEALKALRYFFGKKTTVQLSEGVRSMSTAPKMTHNVSSLLCKIVYSGIPWACEGLGVYGIGVFMPVLIMSLGLDPSHATGIPRIVNSVELTAIINFSILPAFILGLLVVKRLSHAKMLWGGFLGSAVAMTILLIAYRLHWPGYISIIAFIAFELLLHGGPHLVTFIIPTEIYPVEFRGTGTGIADFLGKLGAIVGVFFMPVLLKSGGITLVLEVTIGVMMAGGVIGYIFSKLIKNS